MEYCERAIWAVIFLLVDTWFTLKASWPCLTTLQLRRQKAHRASPQAPTLQLLQALCISFLTYNMGVTGRGLLYRRAYFHSTSSFLTFAFTFINPVEGSFVKLPILAQPIFFSPAFLSHRSDIKESYWENIISEFSKHTSPVAFLTLVSDLGFSFSVDPTPGASLPRLPQPGQLVSGRRILAFAEEKIQHIKALCSSLL